jgi:hypothetical protein
VDGGADLPADSGTKATLSQVADGVTRRAGSTATRPSTLGTFLRSFTSAHSRLEMSDAVAAELLARAWEAGAGPGTKPLTIDVDSTICAVFGVKKQRARFGYTKDRGLHPVGRGCGGRGRCAADPGAGP